MGILNIAQALGAGRADFHSLLIQTVTERYPYNYGFEVGKIHIAEVCVNPQHSNQPPVPRTATVLPQQTFPFAYIRSYTGSYFLYIILIDADFDILAWVLSL